MQIDFRLGLVFLTPAGRRGTSGTMQLAQVFVRGTSISFGNFIVFVSLSHNVPEPCLVAGVD